MAINPKIKQKAEDIRSKIFGSEVRESLASGIEAISENVEATIGRQDYVEEQFQDVLDETTGKDVISAPEIIAARNGKSNLKTRLDDEHAEVTAQLQQMAVNVKEFGAVGDGVNDDSTAFANAIAHARQIGAPVYVPHGTYLASFALNSGVKLYGNGEGMSTTVIKPSQLVAGNGMGAVGQADKYLKDIVVENLAFDTTHSRPYFKHVDGLSMKNIRFMNKAGVRLDSCRNFEFENIHLENTELGIGFMTGSFGTLRNITGKNVSELIDFYNVDFVHVDGVVAETDGAEVLDEIIDIGACRDLTISNVIGKGYRNGLTIKTEQDGHALDNIVISNFTLTDFTNKAIEILNRGSDHLPETNNGSIILNNLMIKSNVAGTRGVTIDDQNPQSKPFDSIKVMNSVIETDLAPLSTQSLQPSIRLKGLVEVTNSRLRSLSFHAVQFISSDDVFVSECDLSGKEMGVYGLRTHGLRVVNSYIHDSKGAVFNTNGHGLWVEGNRIKNISGNGIRVSIDSEMDNYSNILTVLNNQIKNFGVTENYRSGVLLQSTLGSAISAPIKDIMIRGNLFDSPESTNDLNALAFGTNSELFENSVIKDNIIKNVSRMQTSQSENTLDELTRIITDNIVAL